MYMHRFNLVIIILITTCGIFIYVNIYKKLHGNPIHKHKYALNNINSAVETGLVTVLPATQVLTTSTSYNMCTYNVTVESL